MSTRLGSLRTMFFRVCSSLVIKCLQKRCLHLLFERRDGFSSWWTPVAGLQERGLVWSEQSHNYISVSRVNYLKPVKL